MPKHALFKFFYFFLILALFVCFSKFFSGLIWSLLCSIFQLIFSVLFTRFAQFSMPERVNLLPRRRRLSNEYFT